MVERADQIPDAARVVTSETGDPAQDKLMHVRNRFAVMTSFWSDIHEKGLTDDRFIAGEQWPHEIKQDRADDGRPCLTYNLLPSFTRQIVNKVRENRPQIRVLPVESDRYQTPEFENVQGTKDYSLADVYMGIVRNIEHLSRAHYAYDTALKHATHHGFGYFLLKNQESRLDPFVQELVIKRVKNSYEVLLDPSAQEPDYSDMQDAFVFTSIPKTTFKQKWPNVPITSFEPGTLAGNYTGWYDRDNLRIAEYRWIEYKDDEVLSLSNGKVVFYSEVKDVLDEMEEEQGVHITLFDGAELRKKVKRPVCMWQKMTANDILEGPLELPFSGVPIFPVFGEELLVDGMVRYISAIRDAIDPQRSYNYWRTSAAETVALAPRAPIVATKKQIKGYENIYNTANRKNHAWLPYNRDEDAPPPRRLEGATVAAAELALATHDAQDIRTIIGLHEASLGEEGNERSGKAIQARAAQGSTATYQFPDNLNWALEAMGRSLVEAIPRIYDTQRVVRIRMPDDTEDFVEINQSILDKDSKDGKRHLVHDISYGRFDVVYSTGPSYLTQRAEALDNQMKLLDVLPDTVVDKVMHLIVKNMAMPGSDEISTILRKLLPDELKSEDERAADLPKGVSFNDEGQPVTEDGEPYEPPMSPQEQLLQREQELKQAEIEAKQATAEADKKEAEAKIAMAQAKLKEAELALAQVGQGDDGEGQEGIDFEAMLGPIEEIIKQAFAEHESDQAAHKGPIEDVAADAVADALNRVRRYVDQRVAAVTKQAEAGTTAADGALGDNVVNISQAKRLKLENIVRTDGRISSAEVVVLPESQPEAS